MRFRNCKVRCKSNQSQLLIDGILAMGKVPISTDTITSHKYKTLGIKNILPLPLHIMDVYGTPVTFQINVVGVIASLNYSNTCTDKKTFSFTNISQGNLSTVSWDFGDGSPVVNTLNTIHTFPPSGSFVTTSNRY